MLDDHWFDNLNKALVRDFPRRTLPQTAVAVVAGLALGVAPTIKAAKRKKNKKKSKKEKRKGNSREDRCGQVACRARFATAGDIDDCQKTCGRCQRAGLPFCIHGPDDEHPGDHPACCPRGEVCCGSFCCGPPDKATCCHYFSGPNEVFQCIGARVECCDDDPGRACDPDTQQCCPGIGCVDGNECPGDGCSETCVGPGLQCCRRECTDIMSDLDHCGGCLLACRGTGARSCCDGDCKNIGDDEEHCGGCGRTCIGPGLRCCDGACVTTLADPNHCGQCNRDCGGPAILCCDGDCFDSRHDVNHCGACGNECEPGKQCIDSKCGCPPGQVHWACPGGDRTCILDESILCCDSFGCNVGQNDPGDYACCGHTSSQGHCVPSSRGACLDNRFEPYAPHATRTFGED